MPEFFTCQPKSSDLLRKSLYFGRAWIGSLMSILIPIMTLNWTGSRIILRWPRNCHSREALTHFTIIIFGHVHIIAWSYLRKKVIVWETRARRLEFRTQPNGMGLRVRSFRVGDLLAPGSPRYDPVEPVRSVNSLIDACV